MSRWKPSVGDRVVRRWKAWLGVGVVEEIDGRCARVRWPEARPEGPANDAGRVVPLVGWHAPSHLTRPGLRVDSGPGRDQAELFFFLGASRGESRGSLPLPGSRDAASADEARRIVERLAGEGWRSGAPGGI